MEKIKSIFDSYRFSIILITASVIGAIAGLIFGDSTAIVKPIADIFLNLVFVLIVPIIFFSIADAITDMEDTSKLKKILSLFLMVLIIGGIITAVLALFVVKVISVAPSGEISLDTATEVASNFDLVNMITVSDFNKLLSKDNMLPLIIFTIAIGVAINSLGEKVKPVKGIIHSMSLIFMKLISYVMKLAPIGIGSYFAYLVGDLGGQVITSIARLSIVFVGFIIFYFIISNTVMAYFGGGKEGVKTYFSHIWLPLTTAMGTCSSAACIPVNMDTSKKMGIPNEISSIIMPLGGSINKNGVVAVQIMKIAFSFLLFNRTFDFKNMMLAILVSLISGIIVGTIPSGGFIGEMLIVSVFGFPTSLVPILVLMGTLTDPFTTMLSVTNQTSTAMVLSRLVE